MSLLIRDSSVVPPEDWAYYVPQTNFMVKTKNFAQLYILVKQHCLSNGVNPPDQQTVIDYICNNSHVPCYESENAAPLANAWFLNLPVPAKTGCCGGG